jgi:hypothetical protein
LGNDFRIDHGATPRDPPDGVGKVVEIIDSILEEIADATCAVGDQAEGEGRLDVLRQDQDPDRGPVLGPNGFRSAQPFVRVCGRHPDVNQGDVGSMGADRVQELTGLAHLGHDREACLGEQAGDPLTEEERVVGEDEP